MMKICDLIVKIRREGRGNKPFVRNIPVWGKVIRGKDDMLGIIHFSIGQHDFCSINLKFTTQHFKHYINSNTLFQIKEFHGKFPIKRGKFKYEHEVPPRTKFYIWNTMGKDMYIDEYFKEPYGFFTSRYDIKSGVVVRYPKKHPIISISFSNPRVKSFQEIYNHDIAKRV